MEKYFHSILKNGAYSYKIGHRNAKFRKQGDVLWAIWNTKKNSLTFNKYRYSYQIGFQKTFSLIVKYNGNRIVVYTKNHNKFKRWTLNQGQLTFSVFGEKLNKKAVKRRANNLLNKFCKQYGYKLSRVTDFDEKVSSIMYNSWKKDLKCFFNGQYIYHENRFLLDRFTELDDFENWVFQGNENCLRLSEELSLESPILCDIYYMRKQLGAKRFSENQRLVGKILNFYYNNTRYHGSFCAKISNLAEKPVPPRKFEKVLNLIGQDLVEGFKHTSQGRLDFINCCVDIELRFMKPTPNLDDCKTLNEMLQKCYIYQKL